MKNRDKCKDTCPTHSNVEDGRYPFWTSNPKSFQKNAKYGNRPNDSAKDISDFVMKGNEADWRIASGNHNENHHVIQFTKSAVYFCSGVYRVVNGACRIKQDHAEYKNTEREYMQSIFCAGSFV